MKTARRCSWSRQHKHRAAQCARTGGEIDLVCRDGATIVFVEVKRRDTRSFDSALWAVGARKCATLRRIATDYMQIVAPSAYFRFDVVALDGDRLTLHRNVF